MPYEHLVQLGVRTEFKGKAGRWKYSYSEGTSSFPSLAAAQWSCNALGTGTATTRAKIRFTDNSVITKTAENRKFAC